MAENEDFFAKQENHNTQTYEGKLLSIIAEEFIKQNTIETPDADELRLFIERQLDHIKLFDSLEIQTLTPKWDDPQYEGMGGFRILFEPKGKQIKKVLDILFKMGNESEE